MTSSIFILPEDRKMRQVKDLIQINTTKLFAIEVANVAIIWPGLSLLIGTV